MLSRLFTTVVTVGATILFCIIPKASASPVNARQDAPKCQKKALSQKEAQQQSNKNLQNELEANTIKGDGHFSHPSKELCKTLQPSEADDFNESSANDYADETSSDSQENLDTDIKAKDTTDLDANNSDSNSRDSDKSDNSDNYILDDPEEQLNTPPTGQDSHNLNFNLELNLGGGGGAMPLSDDAEVFPSQPMQVGTPPIESHSTTPTNTEQLAPQQLRSPQSKVNVKKIRLKKVKKDKKNQQHEKVKEQKKLDRLAHRKHQKHLSIQHKPLLKSEKQKGNQLKIPYSKRTHQKVHTNQSHHTEHLKRIKPSRHRLGKTIKRSSDIPLLRHYPKSFDSVRKPLTYRSRQHLGGIHPRFHEKAPILQLQRRSQSHPSGNYLRRNVRPIRVFRSPPRRHSR
jgi:hypothetical protein